MSNDVILEIDAGNTEFKWRIVTVERILSSGRAAKVKLEEELPQVLGKQLVSRARVVSVAGEEFDLALKTELNAGGVDSVEFASVQSEIAGVRCGYQDISQLGVDRWMSIIAASNAFSGPVLVVDMGSALTLDLINGQKEHCGGYILPGWQLMKKSLLSGTKINPSRIPESYQVLSIEPGLNTEDAIGMGRLKALTSVIESTLNDFRGRVGAEVTLVCTGGDAPNIIRHLDSEAVYIADLVLDGLAIALD